jgi:hypothetical protein
VSRRTFFVRVPKRDRATLHKVILDWVDKGTVLKTDIWRAYTDIEQRKQVGIPTVAIPKLLSVGTRIGTEAGRSFAPKSPGLSGTVGSFAARPPWE